MKKYILISLISSLIIKGIISPYIYDSATNYKVKTESAESDIIIGKWTVYKTIRTYQALNDSTEFLCYSCPQINFNSDKTATIHSSAKDIDTIQWEINNQLMIITNQAGKIFRSSEYSIKYLPHEEYNELQLTGSIFEDITETIVLRK